MDGLCRCNSNVYGGNEKFTKNQIKKHCTQMTNKEKHIINEELAKLEELTLSNHVYKYIEDNYLSFDFELLDYISISLKNKCNMNNIMEFNQTNKSGYDDISNRVLIRFKDIIKVKCKDDIIRRCNLCCVIDLQKSKVITVYFNRLTDKHSTLDYAKYDGSLDIVKCLQINNNIN